MALIRLLIGTRKGAFFISGDRARRKWMVSRPQFLGHIVHHLVLDPRKPEDNVGGCPDRAPRTHRVSLYRPRSFLERGRTASLVSESRTREAGAGRQSCVLVNAQPRG